MKTYKQSCDLMLETIEYLKKANNNMLTLIEEKDVLTLSAVKDFSSIQRNIKNALDNLEIRFK